METEFRVGVWIGDIEKRERADRRTAFDRRRVLRVPVRAIALAVSNVDCSIVKRRKPRIGGLLVNCRRWTERMENQ
jgi:hypothetical protein